MKDIIFTGKGLAFNINSAHGQQARTNLLNFEWVILIWD